ncbi:hypothetical protein DFH09DRAFT_1181075 [Mycena vulgaris]|nr:hypothetical protein DFH09DRAFT_1181075 [Mycena vulgaris]
MRVVLISLIPTCFRCARPALSSSWHRRAPKSRRETSKQLDLSFVSDSLGSLASPGGQRLPPSHVVGLGEKTLRV